MNRTYTPELDPDVLDRLGDYAAGFRDDFNRPPQGQWGGGYLRRPPPDARPAVPPRPGASAAGFRADFTRPRQGQWCGVYLRGLLQDADRKSIEPMARAVPPRAGLTVPAPHPAPR